MAKTSLSASLALYKLLTECPEVAGLVSRVFPVAVDEAALPYVAYRRSALRVDPVKAPGQGADTLTVELACYAATYAGSVELAESVRGALLYTGAVPVDGLTLRGLLLTGAEEYYEADAYVQKLTYEIRI